MSSPYSARAGAVIEAMGAADLSEKRGYLVTLAAVAGVLTATVSASAAVPATGVVMNGEAVANKSSIGILGAPGIGTVYMKASGVIAAGARVQQAADGTIVTDAGAGNARVVVGVALEAAAAGDLIEVAPLAPMILP
jgi:hypothetical protein